MAGAPTEVGNYSIKIIVAEDTNYLSGSAERNFSIRKAQSPAPSTPLTLDANYSSSGKLSDIALPAGYAWVDLDEQPVCSKLIYRALYNLDEANYAPIEVDVVVNVAPITIDVSLLEIKQSEFEYDGTQKELTFTYKSEIEELAKANILQINGSLTGTEVGISEVRFVLDNNYVWSDGAEYQDFSLVINPADASEAEILIEEDSFSFNGDVITPEISGVILNGTVIGEDCYDVGYLDNNRAGTALIIVTFKGNYAGHVIKQFKITYIPKIETIYCEQPNGAISAYEGVTNDELQAMLTESVAMLVKYEGIRDEYFKNLDVEWKDENGQPLDLSVGNMKNAYAYHQGIKSSSYVQYSILSDEFNTISIDETSFKRIYQIGESLDLSTIKAFAQFQSGKMVQLTQSSSGEEFTFEIDEGDFDCNTPGSYEISIIYGGQIYPINIYVVTSDLVIDDISVDEIIYNLGTALSDIKIDIYATYIDGETIFTAIYKTLDLSNEDDLAKVKFLKPYNQNATGLQNFTITLSEKETTIEGAIQLLDNNPISNILLKIDDTIITPSIFHWMESVELSSIKFLFIHQNGMREEISLDKAKELVETGVLKAISGLDEPLLLEENERTITVQTADDTMSWTVKLGIPKGLEDYSIVIDEKRLDFDSTDTAIYEMRSRESICFYYPYEYPTLVTVYIDGVLQDDGQSITVNNDGKDHIVKIISKKGYEAKIQTIIVKAGTIEILIDGESYGGQRVYENSLLSFNAGSLIHN